MTPMPALDLTTIFEVILPFQILQIPSPPPPTGFHSALCCMPQLCYSSNASSHRATVMFSKPTA